MVKIFIGVLEEIGKGHLENLQPFQRATKGLLTECSEKHTWRSCFVGESLGDAATVSFLLCCSLEGLKFLYDVFHLCGKCTFSISYSCQNITISLFCDYQVFLKCIYTYELS